jgi:hypothetical protein
MRAVLLLYGNTLIYSELTFKQRYQQIDFPFADSIIYSHLSNMCIVGSTTYRSTAINALPAILDLLLFSLIAYKAFRSPGSLTGDTIVCTKFQLSATWKLR